MLILDSLNVGCCILIYVCNTSIFSIFICIIGRKLLSYSQNSCVRIYYRENRRYILILVKKPFINVTIVILIYLGFSGVNILFFFVYRKPSSADVLLSFARFENSSLSSFFVEAFARICS